MARDELPQTFYHYTDAAGLAGILRSHCIWATDVRYLNDSAEFKYALHVVKSRLDSMASQTAAHPELFDEWRRGMAAVPNVRTYVVSFSRLSDSLPQWRAYTRPFGFALGLDRTHVMAIVSAAQVLGGVLKCIYDVNEQQEVVDYALDYLVNSFSSERVRGAETVGAYGTHFFMHLLSLAACLKHPAFKEEQEWRVVLRESSMGFPLARRTRASTRTFVPYAELPIATGERPLPIARLVIGPCPDFDLAELGVRDLLRETGADIDDISRSIVPFRDW